MIFILSITGCSIKTNSICPNFPAPDQHILNSIKSLDDDTVNRWMEDLYKHKLKIDTCRSTH
jgi:hypothetical protein